MSEDDLLTPMEAAALLGVRATAVYQMIDNGQLTLVRLRDERPGTVRVRRTEVDQIIESSGGA